MSASTDLEHEQDIKPFSYNNMGVQGDLEKGIADPAYAVHTTTAPASSENLGDETKWQKFQRINTKMEAKLGIEARGIQRVQPEERHEARLWTTGEVWLAANTVIPCFGLGLLGPAIFYTGLVDSILTILFFNAFTCLLPAFMACFGPKTGLRQMTSARYAWGWYGAKIVAFLNCIACVGWSTANTIAGGQLMSSVADQHLSSAVGCVIIALVTLGLGFFGYKVVHHYERWSWIPTAITFFIMLGVSAKHLYKAPWATGQAEYSDIFSFGGTIFGFAAGWVSLASDYNVYLPEDAPSWKIFSWTYAGLLIPLVLVQSLGAAVYCGTFINEDWATGYKDHELGGLVYQVLIPPLGNFGKFLMVLLVLSVVANNIINVYSMGLSLSVVGSWIMYVPRWIWPIVTTAIYIPLAIVGADSFATTLENFMNILGYWLAIYVTVVLEEHFIFRKGKWANYNLEGWNDRAAMQIGWSAICAGLVGIAGAVLGMSQVWFIGPVAKAVGGSVNPYGGDVGFEMSCLFSGVAFPPLRYLEKKWGGR